MKTFETFNPIAVAIYFFAVAIPPMMCMSPQILLPSFICSVTLFCFTVRKHRVKTHIIMLTAALLMSLINPIYSHKGSTVLFFINDTPFTLESILYGIAASVTVVVTIYWFRSFSEIMTEDKLLYVFGKISPRLALTLSMALRYVSLFADRIRKTQAAQKANGLYSTDSITDSLKSSARVFSVNVTWALENGVITASSMRARGYGLGKRTAYSAFRFRARDTLLLVAALVLLALTAVGIALGGATTEFYPIFTAPNPFSTPSIAVFVPYTVLALIPIFIEAEERIKWKFLTSKI